MGRRVIYLFLILIRFYLMEIILNDLYLLINSIDVTKTARNNTIVLIIIILFFILDVLL